VLSKKVHVLVFYPLLNWKMHGETMKLYTGKFDMLLNRLLTMNRTESAVRWKFSWSWGYQCQFFDVILPAFRWPSCTFPRLLLRKVLTACRTDIGICKIQIFCMSFEIISGQWMVGFSGLLSALLWVLNSL